MVKGGLLSRNSGLGDALCVQYMAAERAQDLENIGYQKEEFGHGDTLEGFPACGDLGYLVKQ